MVIVPIPKPPELENLLGTLMGRPVKVSRMDGHPVAAEPVITGTFTSDEPVLQVLARVELPLAASLAAALSVVPLEEVRDAVSSGQLGESLQDNFGEVMNILSRYLTMGGRPYRLGSQSYPPATPDPALAPLVDASDEKRTFLVEVSGYLAGKLELVTL